MPRSTARSPGSPSDIRRGPRNCGHETRNSEQPGRSRVRVAVCAGVVPAGDGSGANEHESVLGTEPQP